MNSQDETPDKTRRGLLLLNLGTPDSPQVSDVRRYLDEFLMDPNVIDLPLPLRWILVKILILPLRPKRSAKAYQEIWTNRGSPLRFHTQDLTEAVSQATSHFSFVTWAMRYGNPSVESKLHECIRNGIKELTVVPLYPQYALSSTQTAIQKVEFENQKLPQPLRLRFISPFYAHDEFIQAHREVCGPLIELFQPDHTLFSYHGLPVRHVQKTAKKDWHCTADSDCCAKIGDSNKNCYRAQCFHTTTKLQSALGLTSQNSSTSFQSRLGRTPWIPPFTDTVIPELARNGIQKLLVLCPSFVADCLETLEEIGLRGRKLFLENGGQEFHLVPCLNAHPRWVQAISKIVAQEATDEPFGIHSLDN